MSELGEDFANYNSKISVTVLMLTIEGINSWNHEFVVTESEENSFGEVEGDVVSTYFLSSFFPPEPNVHPGWANQIAAWTCSNTSIMSSCRQLHVFELAPNGYYATNWLITQLPNHATSTGTDARLVLLSA